MSKDEDKNLSKGEEGIRENGNVTKKVDDSLPNKDSKRKDTEKD